MNERTPEDRRETIHAQARKGELAWIRGEWLRVNAERERYRHVLESFVLGSFSARNAQMIAKQALEAK